MKLRNSYQGKINGFFAIATDTIPGGMTVEKMTIFYSPDEGKIFKKGDEFKSCLIDGQDNINEWNEVDEPEE